MKKQLPGNDKAPRSTTRDHKIESLSAAVVKRVRGGFVVEIKGINAAYFKGVDGMS